MAVQIFTGNVIAVIWDFDRTLIPGYQQDVLFAEFGIDGDVFWEEVEQTRKRWEDSGLAVSKDTTYLNVMLRYVADERFPGLGNETLNRLGERLELYPGMPDFLRLAKEHIEEQETYVTHGITVEHYVASTGLRQMIRGSAVAPFLTDIWACEFVEEEGRIAGVSYFLDNTTKTRAIWEINKGCNVDASIDVNAMIALEDRRVPIRNMLYIADGPSDIPVFSIMNQ